MHKEMEIDKGEIKGSKTADEKRSKDTQTEKGKMKKITSTIGEKKKHSSIGSGSRSSPKVTTITANKQNGKGENKPQRAPKRSKGETVTASVSETIRKTSDTENANELNEAKNLKKENKKDMSKGNEEDSLENDEEEIFELNEDCIAR